MANFIGFYPKKQINKPKSPIIDFYVNIWYNVNIHLPDLRIN